jgi:hypothetical protein
MPRALSGVGQALAAQRTSHVLGVDESLRGHVCGLLCLDGQRGEDREREDLLILDFGFWILDWAKPEIQSKIQNRQSKIDET